MILISDNAKCCGCNACVQVCHKSCITMQDDEHGFLYPQVNLDVCIDCHLCELVCPFLNESIAKEPLVTYAAINPDEEIRMVSSSGGIFTMLGEQVIANGGVVFGARFNENWEVVHDYTETIEGLASFRGSKYVQSIIGDNYQKAEFFLKQERQVLFTGTPCQISGLKHYLRKDYESLLAVEVACHGVPSPKVWREYIKGKPTKEIKFRDKSSGWKNYSINIGGKSKLHDRDDFMGCFLGNYSLRESCFDCVAKQGKSMADITLADLWGVKYIIPEMDDDKGTSSFVVWSKKGKKIIESLNIFIAEIDFAKVIKYNPAIDKNADKPKNYDVFWNSFARTPIKSISSYAKLFKPSFLAQLKSHIYSIIHP